MKIKSILKVVAFSLAITCFAQPASAEKVLKLGTVGFEGMPIGDAIAQAEKSWWEGGIEPSAALRGWPSHF